jgi:hypothetical protein
VPYCTNTSVRVLRRSTSIGPAQMLHQLTDIVARLLIALGSFRSSDCAPRVCYNKHNNRHVSAGVNNGSVAQPTTQPQYTQRIQSRRRRRKRASQLVVTQVSTNNHWAVSIALVVKLRRLCTATANRSLAYNVSSDVQFRCAIVPLRRFAERSLNVERAQ